MTTRNLFERPELLENQTRLIISADAKPRRLIRSGLRSATGHNEVRERHDSAVSISSNPHEQEEDDDDENLFDENDIQEQNLSIMSDKINYDTDIEQEKELQKDSSCQGVYKDECLRHNVIPSTYFLRHIDQKEMIIRYCGLKPISIKVMVPSLKINRTITKLDLRDNRLGCQGAIYISKLIRETAYIYEINLGNNDIGTEGCKALCRALNLNISVRILYLDENRFNDGCAKYFVDVFNQNEYLTYVNLNKNFFENETTGRLFGQALKENQTIEEFNLAWNRLNSKACGYLLKSQATNVRLTTLDLSWNGAGLFAAKAVNDLLKTNNTLEKLYLENNHFNTECAVYIGKGLSKNETLKILTLNGNPLESSGCYAVLRPLIKHPTCQLETVDVSGIIVNNDFLDLVKELAGVLPNLIVKTGREGEKELA